MCDANPVLNLLCPKEAGRILCANEHVLRAITMTLTLYQLDSWSEEEMKCGRSACKKSRSL